MARTPPPKRKQVAYGLLKDYEEKKKTTTKTKYSRRANTYHDSNGRLRYVSGNNKGKLVFPYSKQ